MALTATSFPNLAVGETLLTDGKESLWRTCPAGYYDTAKGIPTSLLFKESTGDDGCLSTGRSTKTTPQELIKHRQGLGKSVAGAWQVKVSDVQGVGLRAVDDSQVQPPPTSPGHAYIDIRIGRDMSRPEKEQYRSLLLLAALEHNHVLA